MNKTVFFRCDASPKIGTGHVMRCLTFASELKKHGSTCGFIVSEETLNTCPALVKSSFEIFPTDHSTVYSDLLVVDHYFLDQEYEKNCRDWTRQILVLDDLADRPHDCDILVDQTLGRKAEDYKYLVPEKCLILTGPDYALLRPEFYQYRQESLARRLHTGGKIDHILVSMGGTNIHDITSTILQAFRTCKAKSFTIDVVLSSSANKLENVKAMIADLNQKTGHQVTLHLDAPDMAELMTQADLAIGAGGTTSWERCALGLPTIMIEIAGNQKLIADQLHKAGAVCNLGWYEKLKPYDIHNCLDNLHSEKLITMSAHAASICNGKGGRHLIEKVWSDYSDQQICLKKMQENDLDITYQLQSIEGIRNFFRNPEPPTWQEHQEWFFQNLSNPDKTSYLVYYKNTPAGLIRIDKLDDHNNYEVSILINPEYQKKGIASQCLKDINKLMIDTNLFAYIKPDNAGSIALFKKNGYEIHNNNWYKKINKS